MRNSSPWMDIIRSWMICRAYRSILKGKICNKIFARIGRETQTCVRWNGHRSAFDSGQVNNFVLCCHHSSRVYYKEFSENTLQGFRLFVCQWIMWCFPFHFMWKKYAVSHEGMLNDVWLLIHCKSASLNPWRVFSESSCCTRARRKVGSGCFYELAWDSIR